MAQLAAYDRQTTFNATVKESVRLTPDQYKEEVRHIILELDGAAAQFHIGQSIGVSVPGPHAFGNEDHFRLYSIAGIGESESGHGKTVSLCVRRCFYVDDYSGERYPGVASNFMCDLKPGDTLALSGPYPGPFKLPNDRTANLLMVGMGTGIAPFRAFVRHIYSEVGGWQGQVRLFYGAKTGMELLYMNDIKNDLANYYDNETFKAFEAISPRPHFDAPVALDRTIEQNADDVWQLIQDPKTYIYVAGLSKVAELMDAAMAKIAGSEDAWRRRKAELRAGERWAELIY